LAWVNPTLVQLDIKLALVFGFIFRGIFIVL